MMQATDVKERHVPGVMLRWTRLPTSSICGFAMSRKKQPRHQMTTHCIPEFITFLSGSGVHTFSPPFRACRRQSQHPSHSLHWDTFGLYMGMLPLVNDTTRLNKEDMSVPTAGIHGLTHCQPLQDPLRFTDLSTSCLCLESF